MAKRTKRTVFAASKQDRLVYYAFDLLWRDGDLPPFRKLPQIERKQVLSDLLRENCIKLPIIYSGYLIGNEQEMFAHIPRLAAPGTKST